MKRFVMSLALTCVLSSSALAGEIPTVGVTLPTPAGAMASTGEIPTVGLSLQISGAALNLIQTILGIGV